RARGRYWAAGGIHAGRCAVGHRDRRGGLFAGDVGAPWAAGNGPLARPGPLLWHSIGSTCGRLARWHAKDLALLLVWLAHPQRPRLEGRRGHLWHRGGVRGAGDLELRGERHRQVGPHPEPAAAAASAGRGGVVAREDVHPRPDPAWDVLIRSRM